MSTHEEYVSAATSLVSLRGFPRGDTRTLTIAECATILKAKCRDATEALELSTRYQPDVWRSLGHFRKFIEAQTGQANHGISPADWAAHLRTTARNAAVDRQYYGYPYPEAIFQASTPEQAGERALEFHRATETRAALEIQKLKPAERHRLRTEALRIATIWTASEEPRFDGDAGRRASYLKWAAEYILIHRLWLMPHFDRYIDAKNAARRRSEKTKR